MFYNFSDNHPFILSINLCKNNAKPVYSTTELSNLWHYSSNHIRRLLVELKIPRQNTSGKIFIYLKDLILLAKENGERKWRK